MRRILLIALDGLNGEQLSLVASRVPALRMLLRRSSIRRFTAGPLVSPQTIWAELLGGRPWYVLGCPGYSRPRQSLNDVVRLSEGDLDLDPSSMLTVAPAGAGRAVVIGLPLLCPAPTRLFLSDGSLPLPVAAPADLLESEPFASYKPRPYHSAALSLKTAETSLAACIATESHKLTCAVELARRFTWERFFLRINLFDLGFHLLGTDFLERRWDELALYFEALNESLTQILSPASDALVCFVSTFSHVACRARINLNEVLLRGGFLEFDNEPMDSSGSVRVSAALAVARKHDLTQLCAQMPVRLAATAVASPVSGCLYANSAARFAEGIVPDGEVRRVVESASRFVLDYVERATGVVGEVQFREHDWHPAAPDAVVQFEGVDMHDVPGPTVDLFSFPRSLHSADGVVWLSSEPASQTVLSPADLHGLLLQSAEVC